MRILMVSPHPTYTPRGTPISVLNRCRALCALGHDVDLVTYGIGEDVAIQGLRWVRAPVPGIAKVKVGPSASKLPLDAAVFLKAIVRAVRFRRQYDVIHTHEEAGILGAALSKILRIPHVYDMGNDLSVVLDNYGFSPRNPLTRLAVAVETATIRGSHSVIAHFPAIADRVATVDDGRVPATVVSNVPIEMPADSEVIDGLRKQWSPDGLPIALYTGTLEMYQGVPALIEAAGLLVDRGVKLRIVIIGGSAPQCEELRDLVRRHGVQDTVSVLGAVPMDLIRSCLQAADLLLSPRAGGSNTPLKIFSYMHSGKPLLATRITGHTQVLDDDSAQLVEPTPDGLADGIAAVLEDPEAAATRAAVAFTLAEKHYGIRSFVHTVAQAYLPVGGRSQSGPDLDLACRLLEHQLLTGPQ